MFGSACGQAVQAWWPKVQAYARRTDRIVQVPWNVTWKHYRNRTCAGVFGVNVNGWR